MRDADHLLQTGSTNGYQCAVSTDWQSDVLECCPDVSRIVELGWSFGGGWLGIAAETSCSNGRSESEEVPRVLPEKPSIYAKFTPMTSPSELRTGPPLPPCALDASEGNPSPVSSPR